MRQLCLTEALSSSQGQRKRWISLYLSLHCGFRNESVVHNLDGELAYLGHFHCPFTFQSGVVIFTFMKSKILNPVTLHSYVVIWPSSIPAEVSVGARAVLSIPLLLWALTQCDSGTREEKSGWRAGVEAPKHRGQHAHPAFIQSQDPYHSYLRNNVCLEGIWLCA